MRHDPTVRPYINLTSILWNRMIRLHGSFSLLAPKKLHQYNYLPFNDVSNKHNPHEKRRKQEKNGDMHLFIEGEQFNNSVNRG